jgi:hypothetical protein
MNDLSKAAEMALEAFGRHLRSVARQEAEPGAHEVDCAEVGLQDRARRPTDR